MPERERLPPGWAEFAFDEIDSTNAEAMRRAVAGETGPLWITARRQSKGRGRSGRSWASAEGSLAATLLYRPACPMADLPQLSLVAGIATHDAISSALLQSPRPECRLKWPNDVLVSGAKVSGILIESTVLAGEPVVAIGIGINVGKAPALGDRHATGLSAHGARLDPAGMSGELAKALARWIAIWEAGSGFAEIRDAWLERAGPPGEAMTVHAGDELVSGTFAGLGGDGSLVMVDSAGQRRNFTFGDVALGAPRV